MRGLRPTPCPALANPALAGRASRRAIAGGTSRRTLAFGAIAALFAALPGCTRPAEQRAEAELLVGSAELSDAAVRVAGGLAAVHELADQRLVLWAQAPVLDIELEVGPTAIGQWAITIRNALPDAQLVVGGTSYVRAPEEHPTIARFVVPLEAGVHSLTLAPPDADTAEPFRVAAMADIQTALPTVDDVFEAINAVPNLRFVVGMGDITERAEDAEYELFERQLVTLQIPFYTTLGNHELWAPYEQFFHRFGRASFQFTFKGVAFTFADSGDSGVDPLVEDWLEDWLAAARDRTSIFLTHIPPLDPVGARYGGFRSGDDGRRLLARLAEGAVDLTLYGHIHTFVEFENAGIPAYISGGGGALPMRWDGVDRHFLVVEAGPAGIGTVERVEVD